MCVIVVRPSSDVRTCVTSLQQHLQVVISCRCCCSISSCGLTMSDSRSLAANGHSNAMERSPKGPVTVTSSCVKFFFLLSLILPVEYDQSNVLCKLLELLYVLKCNAWLYCGKIIVSLCFHSGHTQFVRQRTVVFWTSVCL